MKLDPIADIVVTSILMDRPMNLAVNDLSLEQACDLQDAVVQRLLAPLDGQAGYKIAWNTDAQLEAMGMPHPGMGRVFRKNLRKDGATLKLEDYRNLMVEVEIVAFLGKDIAPGGTYVPETIVEHISGFTTGFEILDRHHEAGDANAHACIAHNVFNAGAVLGGLRLPAVELEPSRLTTRFLIDGEIVSEGRNKAPQDPLEAVCFIANHFTKRGHTLKTGELILCGSHIPLHPITEPGRYSVSMGPLGDVSFRVI